MQFSQQPITDVLTRDQRVQAAQRNRLMRNVDALKRTLGAEVQTVNCHFTYENGQINLDPLYIGYLSNGLFHCTLEKRKALELLEISHETESGFSTMSVPLFLHQLCKDAAEAEQCWINDGRGFLYIRFNPNVIHVRALPENYKAEEGKSYPFLLML